MDSDVFQLLHGTKKHSLEQVLPKFYQVLYTLHKKLFTVATFKDLWVDPFQAD